MQVLFLIVFLDILGFGIIVPMFPALKEIYHLDEMSIGLLASSFFFASIFGSIALGYLSDKFGRKKILVISLFGLVISYGGSAFIHTFDHGFALFLFFRMLCGLFSGSMAVSFAAGANISTEKNMLKNIGILSAGFSAGFILGPTVGGFALSFGGDIKLPFYATALAYLLCLLVVILFFKEPSYNKNEKAEPILPAIIKILSNKNILLFVILFVLLSLCITGLEVIYLTYLLSDHLKLSPSHVGLVWTYFAIITTLVQMFLCRYIKPSLAVVGGFILWGLSIFMLSFVNNIYDTLLVTTLIAFGLGLLFPNINAHLALNGSGKQQGTIFGINFAAESVGGSVGPYALGYILFMGGSLMYVWGTLGIICILCGLMALIHYCKKPKV